jgi:hypothetical protein
MRVSSVGRSDVTSLESGGGGDFVDAASNSQPTSKPDALNVQRVDHTIL